MTDTPPDVPDENILRSDEVNSHLIFIEKALTTKRQDIRRRALAQGFLHFGLRFAHSLGYLSGRANHQGPFQDLQIASQKILVEWLQGQRLTESEEEDERRAEMAAELLNNQVVGLGRLAAKCLLSLPEDHPKRDVGLAREALLNYLAKVRNDGDLDGQVLAMHDLLDFQLEPLEESLRLISQGMALADKVSHPDHRHDFHLAAVGYYLLMAIESRDKSNPSDQAKWAQAAAEILNRMQGERPEFFETAKGIRLVGAVMELNRREQEAAALFAAAVDQSSEQSSFELDPLIEARYRVKSKEYERIAAILPPIIPALEKKYLLAVNDRDIADAGTMFSEAVRTLAFSYANLGNWAEAVRFVERGKSLRLRYQGALRQIPTGKRLLKLERQLYALERGVPIAAGEFEKNKSEDWLGSGVSLKTKILETYRSRRPRKPSELLASPSIDDVAKSLATDEAVVTLGLDRRCGTLMVVICPGDSDHPAGRFLWPERTLAAWIPAFAGENENGWVFALGAPEAKVDAKNALTMLLAAVDKDLGQPLNEFLKTKRIRQVTIIPHLWFHLVPFWGLPSLESYDVTMAASLGHFMQSRSARIAQHRESLVVADPTGDLPGSLAEAEFVETHLSKLGFKVNRLTRETAAEDQLMKGLRRASLLHFCGHGRSDFDHPMRSSLLVYPKPDSLPSASDDPFESLSADAGEWITDENEERSTEISGVGRLYERKIDDDTVERRIEYGERGTLWGLHRKGTLSRLAELWTAGDILAEGSLKDCQFVFLSACEAGGGGMSSERDEYSGLPAALQVAGASTIICSLWPVSDGLTALYVDLFYEALARQEVSANVVSIARKTGKKLRGMNRRRAASLLRGLSARTSSARASFKLEAYAMQVAKGPELPFSHPYDWAAFFVTGNSNWHFPQEKKS